MPKVNLEDRQKDSLISKFGELGMKVDIDSLSRELNFEGELWIPKKMAFSIGEILKNNI